MTVKRSCCKSRINGVHLVAIGANLPGPAGQTPLAACFAAAQRIISSPYARRGVASRCFSSAPVPVSDQPRYVNMVVRFEAAIAPPDLLAALQAIEREFGRVRGAPNAARTLDLDIIDMGGLVRAAPDPILPHPRAHERAFVLLPLRDVAPCWVHPGLGLTVGALLARLPPQDIRPEGGPERGPE